MDLQGQPLSSKAGVVFGSVAAALFASAILYVGFFGIPGGAVAGSSPSQQQTSGAPIGGDQAQTGRTRETTGYGTPVK